VINDVQNSINTIVGSVATLLNANGAGRIFELYVMTRIASQLLNSGCDVWLQRSDETRVLAHDADRRFIQRGGGPTGISSKNLGPNNQSSICFSKPNSVRKWEIWNGIQHRGRSDAYHEIDIAIVPEETAKELRISGGMPFGRPRVAIECKDVGTTGNLDESRAFVARLYDLTILQGHRAYIGQSGPTAQSIYPGALQTDALHVSTNTFRQENQRTFNAIARRSGFSLGTAALNSYYSVRPHSSVKHPSIQADQLVNDAVNWIMTNLP
jgi:hypothetical protein